LLVLLFTVLTIGYVNQTQQTDRKENIKTLVLDAVTLIQLKGESAFPEFRQEGTRWFYDDTYVFVWRTDGIRLVYPPDVTGEGQNVSTLVDYTGKPIGKIFIDVAISEKGEGWVDYEWPKPGRTMPSTKQTFIKGVTAAGQDLLVGSSLYLEINESIIKPLQYVAVAIESGVAAIGLLLAVRKKRFFGYGIFLTFIIYVFYDLAKLIPLEISNIALYPMFFIATLSILWVMILIYKEKRKKAADFNP
jgi:signal transduction histidine kinase